MKMILTMVFVIALFLTAIFYKRNCFKCELELNDGSKVTYQGDCHNSRTRPQTSIYGYPMSSIKRFKTVRTQQQ